MSALLNVCEGNLPVSGAIHIKRAVMGLLPDMENCGLRMRRECRERFPRHYGLAIPTCITARAWRTCRDAYRDRLPAVSFEVRGGENVPGIPGACATHNFTYLVRGPCRKHFRAMTAGIFPATMMWRVDVGRQLEVPVVRHFAEACEAMPW